MPYSEKSGNRIKYAFQEGFAGKGNKTKQAEKVDSRDFSKFGAFFPKNTSILFVFRSDSEKINFSIFERGHIKVPNLMKKLFIIAINIFISLFCFSGFLFFRAEMQILSCLVYLVIDSLRSLACFWLSRKELRLLRCHPLSAGGYDPAEIN